MPTPSPPGRARSALLLFGCFALLATLAALVGADGFSRMNALNLQLRNTAEARNNKIALVQEMVASARARADLLLARNLLPAAAGVDAPSQYPGSIESFLAARDSFLALSVSPEEGKLLESVMAAAEQVNRRYRDAEAADATGTAAGGRKRDQGLGIVEARKELETALGRLLELQRTAAFREVSDASEQNAETFRLALRLQAAALAVSILVGALAAWLVWRSEGQLRRGKELAQATLGGIVDGIVTVDAAGRVLYMNPRAESLTGWSLAEARRRSLAEIYTLVSAEGRKPLLHPANRPEIGPMSSGDGNLLVARDGREYEVQDSATAIGDDPQRVTGAVLVFRDLTEARKMRRELDWHAAHDRLTGLDNREQFEQTLAQAIRQAATGHSHALLFLDLDQFNVINNTCGHVGGDQLLCRIADLLRDSLTEADVIARLSGDDFAVLLRDRSLERAVETANALCARVRALRFDWQGRICQVTTSIGVAPVDQTAVDPAQVMGAADIACHAAKEAGRDCVMVHQPEGEGASRMQAMSMVSQIQRAIDAGSFVLYRQRIQGLHPHNRADRHFEVLLRMIDTDGRTLAPGVFLPAAERYNLMRPIDRWVVQAALAQLRRKFASAPDEAGSLHTINLSGATINDPGFAAFLAEQLAINSVPASSLCFEITETMAISNLSRAAELMRAVKATGCRFAIDDFGMGMSSFAYLKHLPVDYLKIDGEFIRNILRDRIDHEIVDAIARICRSLAVRTVAEFVEDEAMMPVLARLGVDYAQGFAIGKPAPLD